jgi:flavin reductase (DIM6/NTAB) family NADH-FMN oxidoreductase RutF
MEFSEKLQSLLEKYGENGVFLTAGNKPNTMTASWGFAGVMWNKPIIIVPVRPSRFTHDLIVYGKEFSVSVPLDKTVEKFLGYFGSVSGRDIDKYAEKGIMPAKCKSIATCVFPYGCMNFECKLVYTNNIIKERLTPDLKKLYADDSYHTMFYGEIVEVYRN